MECPTCHEDADFAGTLQAELFHFMRRGLWDLHHLRQSFQRAGKEAQAEGVSYVIRHLETVAASAVESPEEH